MKYTAIRNPQWSNAEHTVWHCEVNFEKFGWLPFTPSADDSEPHSVEIFRRVASGEFGPIADYVKKPDEYPQENPAPPPIDIPGAIL